MSAAIEIEQLSHWYGDCQVLGNLTFSIKRGGFFIIVGPNGSGKTTLMKIISGLVGLQQGTVKILGRSIRQYTRRSLAIKMAYVPQMVPPDFPFTVTEMVLMGRSPHLGLLGIERHKDLAVAREAMAFTGVDRLAERKLDQLSGGERQRVFIARAICQDPQVILLDEPTASLDLAHQIRVMDLMERLKKEKNMTVVMVSHDINLAAMYAESMLLLNQGRVSGLGRPRDVLTYQALEEAYGCTLLVDTSPIGGYPRVTLVPQKHMTSES
jgi:iron complex transport system ATP-binding protein